MIIHSIILRLDMSNLSLGVEGRGLTSNHLFEIFAEWELTLKMVSIIIKDLE